MTKSILILMAYTPVALWAQPAAQMRGEANWMNPRGQAGPIVGKPLSAVETFQQTQTLADGTHLNSGGSAKFYRDSQGRMRSESEQAVVIFDPVAGCIDAFMIGTKGYREYPIPADAAWLWILARNRGGGWSLSYDKKLGPEVGPKLPDSDGAEPPVTTELPAQNINGIWATGTRVTMNLPAGAAGNSKAVQVVREQWYSTDLGVIVQSTISDPRFGTTTYALTEVQKGGPDASLFRAPEGYVKVPTPDRGAKK